MLDWLIRETTDKEKMILDLDNVSNDLVWELNMNTKKIKYGWMAAYAAVTVYLVLGPIPCRVISCKQWPFAIFASI
jgi:hypothetical protein